MKRRPLFHILCGAAVAATAAIAASIAAPAAWAQAPNASGEVVKLDKDGGRITIKHGEIKNLDMPPMTMVFRVKDRQLLQEVAVGDRVRFAAERIDGNYTVTALNRLP